MFRVPVNSDRPTYDRTFKVSFGRWLLSTRWERREWRRRRDAAARLAASNQQQRWNERLDPDHTRHVQVDARRRDEPDDERDGDSGNVGVDMPW